MGVDRFKDGNHALLMGGVMGLLLGLEKADYATYKVEPVMDDEGNYTDTILLHADSGTYEVTCRPTPTVEERRAELEELERSLR